jgi:hypothetical protein
MAVIPQPQLFALCEITDALEHQVVAWGMEFTDGAVLFWYDGGKPGSECSIPPTAPSGSWVGSARSTSNESPSTPADEGGGHDHEAASVGVGDPAANYPANGLGNACR